MHTQEEIVKRFESRRSGDMLGFELSEYIPYLTYENAKLLKLPKEDTTEAMWEEMRSKNPYTREAILKTMEEYMSFAWEKAIDQRGISANRSIMHYIAWVWLIGDDDFSATIDKEFDEHYEFYGKDILVMICRHYGWDPERWDDHVRSNGD